VGEAWRWSGVGVGGVGGGITKAQGGLYPGILFWGQWGTLDLVLRERSATLSSGTGHAECGKAILVKIALGVFGTAKPNEKD